MNRHRRWCGLAAILFTLVSIGSTKTNAKAQAASDSQTAQDAQPQASQSLDPQQDAQSSDQDPPGRVAQLNYLDGAVSFQPSGENDWIDAELNRPLVTGDNLWADQNSRAELHIGSTALHLGAMTGITLLEVSDHVAQVRLVQGTLIVKVRHVDNQDAYEIDTPNVAFAVSQPGAYRIDVDADGTRTDVTVWHGRGEVTGGGSSYEVVANQHAVFTGADQLTCDMTQLPGSDGFDTWAQQRDDAEDQSEAATYVSNETTGYENLDQYGTWASVEGYGTVWLPQALPIGWAPYRFGHWAWVGPWGWTWVANEPWGFAPFHYGRWAYTGSNWAWVPGPMAVRPIYAPALVAWVGGAPGAHFAFSFGAGVGWVPLAPGEVFQPYYRVSRSYVNTVNLTNTRVEMTRINNVYNPGNRSSANSVTYANRNVNGAVTVVSRESFVNARPVAANVVSVPAKELADAPVSRTVGAEPVRASVLGAARPAANKPPAVAMTRQVVALRTPPPTPASFARREAAAGGNSDSTALVHRTSPGRPVVTPTRVTLSGESQEGFRSFAPSSGNNQAKAAPIVWEEQGTPEPPKSTSTQQNAQRATAESRSAQSSQPSSQASHSAARTAAPAQTRSAPAQENHSSWHQEKSWSSSSSKGQSASTSSKTSSPAHK